MAFSNELKDNIKSQYTNDIVDGFYKPVLREANLYQRVSGFFFERRNRFVCGWP